VRSTVRDLHSLSSGLHAQQGHRGPLACVAQGVGGMATLVCSCRNKGCAAALFCFVRVAVKEDGSSGGVEERGRKLWWGGFRHAVQHHTSHRRSGLW